MTLSAPTTELAEREREAFARVDLARHPARPRALQVIARAFTDFTEQRGDRLFGDDRAVVGGPAKLDGRWVMVIGQEKGVDAMSRAVTSTSQAAPFERDRRSVAVKAGTRRQASHPTTRSSASSVSRSAPAVSRRA